MSPFPLTLQEVFVLDIFTRSGKTCFQVRLQPRASHNEVAGLFHGAVRIRLTSPPIENKANRQLEEFLASILETPRSSIEIVSGKKSRLKTIAVSGLSRPEVNERLTPYLV